MEELEHKSFVKKNLIWLLVTVALVVFGLLFFNGWDRVVNESVDNMTTVTGNFSCLPLKVGKQAPADCTLGVRSKDSRYYALDLSHIQDANTDLKVDDTIAATGFVLPASEVNASQWEQFKVQAVIRVNTLLRTR